MRNRNLSIAIVAILALGTCAVWTAVGGYVLFGDAASRLLAPPAQETVIAAKIFATLTVSAQETNAQETTIAARIIASLTASAPETAATPAPATPAPATPAPSAIARAATSTPPKVTVVATVRASNTPARTSTPNGGTPAPASTPARTGTPAGNATKAPTAGTPSATITGQPLVQQIDPAKHPALDADLSLICNMATDSFKPSPTCPVLVWGKYTYWAYSFRDNRGSMAVVAYDQAGAKVKRWDHDGARYLVEIKVDASTRTVTLVGQDGLIITIGWDELQSIP